jgi:hypothetical protein
MNYLYMMDGEHIKYSIFFELTCYFLNEYSNISHRDGSVLFIIIIKLCYPIDLADSLSSRLIP